METLYPLLFDLNFHQLVWGGNRLKPFKGLTPSEDDKIGESWEISAVRDNESVVANGPLKGMKLNDLVSSYKELLLGKVVFSMYGETFPLLVKFIDAAHDLSIQVHPNDELAMNRHGCFGKTEMWYVMDALPEAKLYCGFNSRISKYEYGKRVEDHSICEVLQEYPVKSGDVFFIPAGRVHAICGGSLIAEVQQSSDVTYRIYDYGRLGLDGQPRELHTELAKDAIDYNVVENYKTEYERKLNKPVCISECQFFTVKLLEINRGFHRKLFKYDSFIIYMCLEGNCTIKVLSTRGFDGDMPMIREVHLSKGNSCLVPAAVADIMITPMNEEGRTKLLEVYIDNKHFNKE